MTAWSPAQVRRSSAAARPAVCPTVTPPCCTPRAQLCVKTLHAESCTPCAGSGRAPHHLRAGRQRTVNYSVARTNTLNVSLHSTHSFCLTLIHANVCGTCTDLTHLHARECGHSRTDVNCILIAYSLNLI